MGPGGENRKQQKHSRTQQQHNRNNYTRKKGNTPDASSQMAVVGPVFGVSDDETGQLVALAMARPQDSTPRSTFVDVLATGGSTGVVFLGLGVPQ